MITKTYYIHCGNYRKFEVDAVNEEVAVERFNEANPAGFSKKDITEIDLKN